MICPVCGGGEFTSMSVLWPQLINDWQLSDAEVEAAVVAAVASTGAAGPQDMGKVIGVLKGQLAGKADMGKVSGLVKAALAK